MALETEIAFRCPKLKGLVNVVAGAAFDFTIEELERTDCGRRAEASSFSRKGRMIIYGDRMTILKIDPEIACAHFPVLNGLISGNSAVMTGEAYF
jgi:hypothetical protein